MHKKWKISLITLVLVGIGGAVFAFTGCSIFGCKNQLAQFAIDSFEECADAGYLVVPSDPPRCVIDKYHIFTQDLDFIRIAFPEPFEIVASPLSIRGQARAKNNTVYYRLQSNDEVVLDEGTFNGNSPDHGSWGAIDIQIHFELPEVPAGMLFLFEYGQSWNDEKVIRIPLNFNIGDSLASEIPEDAEDPESNFAQASFDPLKQLQSISLPNSITLKVPFTPQAPFADWSDPYNEACEEASLLMVDFYLQDLNLSRAKADYEIVRQVKWQAEKGYTVDITSQEVAQVARDFFNREAKRYGEDEVSVENIKRLLTGGYPVIVPAAGQLLGNPNFRGAGPPYHMLVITGYDEDEFITNDPGTRNGENFRYDYETLMNAIHDWIGNKDSIQQGPKAMVVLRS